MAKANLPTLPKAATTTTLKDEGSTGNLSGGSVSGGTTTSGKPNLPTLPSTTTGSAANTGSATSNPIANEVAVVGGGTTAQDVINGTGLISGGIVLPTQEQINAATNQSTGKPDRPALPTSTSGNIDWSFTENTVQNGVTLPTTGVVQAVTPTGQTTSSATAATNTARPETTQTTVQAPVTTVTPTQTYQQWLEQNPTTTPTTTSKPAIEVDFQESAAVEQLPSNVQTPAQSPGNTFPVGDAVVLPTVGSTAGKPDIPSVTPSTGGGTNAGNNTGAGTGTNAGTNTGTNLPGNIVLPGGAGNQTPGGQTTTTPSEGKVETPDTEAKKNEIAALLEAWKNAADEQSKAQIEYAVEQAVLELQRAEEDAQAKFKEQAESVAIDERQGMDNAALYAEARGDKGGIGLSQYNEIQAAAAQNRLAVQQEQTKLSTDTARQIADLRAKGEFEKADALLETAQTYLQQLVQLEQWAAEYGLSAAQFQAQLDQWQKEYDLALEKFNSSKDQWSQEFNAQQAQNAINNTLNQAKFDQSVAEWASQLEGATSSLDDLYKQLQSLGVTDETTAKAQIALMGYSNADAIAAGYESWAEQNGSITGPVGPITNGMIQQLDSYVNNGGANAKAAMVLYIAGLNISDADKVKLAQMYNL